MQTLHLICRDQFMSLHQSTMPAHKGNNVNIFLCKWDFFVMDFSQRGLLNVTGNLRLFGKYFPMQINEGQIAK